MGALNDGAVDVDAAVGEELDATGTRAGGIARVAALAVGGGGGFAGGAVSSGMISA